MEIYPYSLCCLAFLWIDRISVTNNWCRSQNCYQHDLGYCYFQSAQNFPFFKLRQKRCCRTPACYISKKLKVLSGMLKKLSSTLTLSLKGTSKNLIFVTIRRYSKKIIAYISTICRAQIFYSCLVLLRNLNF